MTSEEFNTFLFNLNALTTFQEKQNYARAFYDKMLHKYGNQFDASSQIDELIEILKGLKIY